ncbi:PREDICTED: leucine carboxyl methyltransferase 1, partial [Papilio polytes]
MNNIISWTAEDEAIIATNTDATECKRCAVELGYWKDDYIVYFAKHVDRKAPEINRGYYARVKAMEMFIHQFLERCGTKCQIINLGCGFDTLYWKLKDSTQAVGNFIELDFPSVVAKKSHIIKRNKQLLEKISNEDGEV